MKKSNRLFLIGTLAAACVASTAFAHKSGTVVGHGSSKVLIDTVSGGGALKATLSLYGSQFGESGGKLNVTTASSGRFNSRLTTNCRNVLGPLESKTIRADNVLGTSAGDLHYICPALTNAESATGAIDDI